MVTPTAPSATDRTKPHWLLGDIPAMTLRPKGGLKMVMQKR